MNNYKKIYSAGHAGCLTDVKLIQRNISVRLSGMLNLTGQREVVGKSFSESANQWKGCSGCSVVTLTVSG